MAASSSGDGGDIDADAGGNATIRGTLIADGGATEGANGGSISVAGCAVRVESTARLSSLHTGGTNTLIGRDSTVVLGTLRADPGSGRNVFRFAGPDYEPAELPDSEVNPPATLLEDLSIVPCNPVNTRTPTPTWTPGPSPTATASRAFTATPTETPPACVGDCDGSGTVTVSDLITGVNIVLGNRQITSCPAFDADRSGTVTIGELIQGVNNALGSCA